MRAPVRLSIWLNETDLRETALNSLTGMLTSPKLIDPLHIAVGMSVVLPFRSFLEQWHPPPHRQPLPFWRGEGQTTPRSLAQRVSSWRVDSCSLRRTAE